MDKPNKINHNGNTFLSEYELQQLICSEREMYIGRIYNPFLLMLFPNRRYLIWRCLSSFRKMQFYHKEKNNFGLSWIKRMHFKILFYLFNRLYLKYSERCGIELDVNSRIGKSCDIWHGGIVINGDLGDNCVLHGQNTIGNKGIGRSNEKPVIGNGVDIGVGAVIIGNIKVADRVKIGANAAVVKSVDDIGATVVGIPAHPIR